MTAMCLLLAVGLVVILIGCDLFTNGLEWAGKRLKLSEGAVGSVLAAVGTCLPETLIAILAVVYGKKTAGGESIGIGAILGAPLMLSTLAFFITGCAVIYYARTGRRSIKMRVSLHVLVRDLRFFVILFSLSALATWLPNRPLKLAAALILICLYGLYVYKTFRSGQESTHDEEISPLHFHKHHGTVSEPKLWLILVQSAVGLITLALGAKLFVNQLSTIAIISGISPLILSLVLTPIATELPEKFNSVLWVRQKKDTLALGNITGAMVFQSSVSPAIGLVFTTWELDAGALGCVLVALLSTLVVGGHLAIRKRLSPYSLLMGGAFYVLYLIWLWIAHR